MTGDRTFGIPADCTVVFSLCGGLGNQLFQVAGALAVFEPLMKQGRLAFETSWFDTEAHEKHEVKYPQLLAALAECGATVISAGCREAKGKGGLFGLRRKQLQNQGLLDNGSSFEFKADLYPRSRVVRLRELLLDGDFILHNRVRDYLQCLVGGNPLNGSYGAIAEALGRGNGFCSVHVRRGDYLRVASFLPNIAYYQRSMQLCRKFHPDLEFVVHSDDLQWCRDQELFARFNCQFLDAGDAADPLQEILVLSEAKAAITSNSTFSWWSSALAAVRDEGFRQSFMPYQWFVGSDERLTRSFVRSDSLCVKSW